MSATFPSRLISACTAVLLIASAAAGAAEVYRWTDSNGRVHLTDTPPPGADSSVVGGQRRAHNPEQERLDEERRVREEERAHIRRLQEIRRTRSEAAAASRPAQDEPAVSVLPGARQAGADGECARLHQAYRASLECYAGFRTANQGLKASAVERCGPAVADPSARCGPAR